MAKINTARVDAQIAKAKARLSALYAKRREIIAASKPPKRMSAKECRQQIVALARAGADMATIVAKVQLSKATIRFCLWQSIADTIDEELEKEGKTDADGDTSRTTYEAKELEIKKQLYPGIKWRMGGNYGNYRTDVAPVDWRRLRYRFNDGTIDPDPADDDGDRPEWETTWKEQKPA